MSSILTNDKKWDDYGLNKELIDILYANDFNLPSLT